MSLLHSKLEESVQEGRKDSNPSGAYSLHVSWQRSADMSSCSRAHARVAGALAGQMPVRNILSCSSDWRMPALALGGHVMGIEVPLQLPSWQCMTSKAAGVQAAEGLQKTGDSRVIISYIVEAARASIRDPAAFRLLNFCVLTQVKGDMTARTRFLLSILLLLYPNPVSSAYLDAVPQSPAGDASRHIWRFQGVLGIRGALRSGIGGTQLLLGVRPPSVSLWVYQQQFCKFSALFSGC